MTRVRQIVDALYGPDSGAVCARRLARSMDEFKARHSARMRPARPLTGRAAMLITYGDMVHAPGVSPLNSLSEFLSARAGEIITSVHVLPFYPYSSDDGFSVIDYRAVAPQLGGWGDIAALGEDFRLMFDAVINHISAQSEWFKRFLADDPDYREWFIAVDGDPDLSQVVRPRALPLLTPVETPSGQKQVWTTFSTDQVDLNYGNPDVLVEIVDTLLFYIARGAEFIRLDAIAYLWKEIGTSCIHLPQTHQVIRLFRAILDEVAPHVRLITETNVPHKDNLSYFGNGQDEAQLVYNFALPPLVMHTFRTGSARAISGWARDLGLPPGDVTFFNFLASHDGIGLNPARGILSDDDIDALVAQASKHGGHVSYKNNADGSRSPYELNINYFDALSDPKGGEPVETQAARFLASQAIMLAMPGLPGIYFHSLFGSRGWPEGVRLTGRARTINRQKLNRHILEADLDKPASLRARVFEGYARLLRARASSPAFDPYGAQEVLDCGDAVFGLRRTSPDGAESVVCLHNVTNAAQQVDLPGLSFSADLLGGEKGLSLAPYQVAWLKIDPAS